MVQGHVAGIMCRDDQYWCDCRWTLTDKGRRGTMAQLERVILRDPPLHVAEQKTMADAATGRARGDPPEQLRHLARVPRLFRTRTAGPGSPPEFSASSPRPAPSGGAG
jgi:hypothetical protein